MIYHYNDIESAARWLLDKGSAYTIWAFQAEMGGGKTTLIKSICEQLGVEDEMSSPSFAIVNEYLDGRENAIFHFDFYRIKNEAEAVDVGVEEYFYTGDRCLIEWPDLVKNLLPDRYLEINIKLVGEFQREIVLVEHDGEN
ncbi:MAG: tRNA (adenosine(37)-N6)-threonylcarbamoyltransferase complex ATPase subunit type 1 TsaE [Cyclobacteriaceae bacterium]